MIEARRQQLHFGEGLIAEEVSDLREKWMPHVDKVLEEEQLVTTAYEALAKRSPKSRPPGRRGTPAEVVYGYCCSSTSATGATRCWNAKSAPIWFIAIALV